jgi:DNA-3-methyladenine glycosylase II
MYAKLVAQIGTPTITRYATLQQQQLQQIGITKQKAQYIIGLAIYLQQHKGFLNKIKVATIPDAITMLTAIKGIGYWSANVILLVMYNKLDVYPPNDVALIKGISLASFSNATLNNDEAQAWIQQFSPYQSIAVCYYYWAYICIKGVQFVP